MLASVDNDSTIILWDLATGKPLSQPLLNFDQSTGRQTVFNGGFTFSPDGTMLASTGIFTATLWDVARREPATHAFQEEDAFGQNTFVRGVTFSPNGQLVVIFTQLSTSYITQWDVNRESWQALACSIANRNLTLGEWTRFVGVDTPYQKVCANLPVDSSVITDILQRAHTAALAGNKQDASMLYTQAVRWANGDAQESSDVCGQGSLAQYAQLVLPACDYAIKSEPNNPAFLTARGRARASLGDTPGATADFKQATQLVIASKDANESDNVCWYGSLARLAQVVLPACEHAVALDPNPNNRDSRGLARALLGDTQGAIDDFQFVVQESQSSNAAINVLTPNEIKERQMWLQELKAGRNPFDAKTLKALQNE